MSHLRPPTGTPIRSLCLLSMCFLLLRPAVSQEQVDLSASGFTCIPECSAGYECVLGQCTRQQCSKDCNGEEQQLVCGSNGVTYNSPCELEKARCEQMTNIVLEYEGTCITPPPPPIPLCKIKQKEFDTYPEHWAECVQKGYAKYNSGERLTPDDIVDCFRPQCNTTTQLFMRKQCSLFFEGYCWCTTPYGTIINDTFQRNMPEGYCDNRKKCELEVGTYDDGDVFTLPNTCELCECLDGNYTCFKTFDLNGTNLDADQLYTLKEELIQVFNFQYNHRDHIHVDIRHIFKYPAGVTTSKKERILDWKFSHYNRNKDSVLNPAEEYIFHQELLKIFGCSKFFDQLSTLMDADENNKITKSEWKAFFDLTTQQELQVQPKKREALLSPLMTKKPLHLRKKFYYILQ